MPVGATRRGVGDDPFNISPSNTSQLPISSFGDPSNFAAGASTQAGDYDTIMKSYRDLAANYAKNPLTAGTVTPQITPYKQSQDVTGSLANLSNLATTGGLSEGDIQNIRERDISPIRSIYANAQQNVERQRALGGGYSPNFNATQQQMARDEASAIGDRTTAANAGIAEMVQRGKLSAAPQYASAAESANRLQAGISEGDVQRAQQAGEFNVGTALEAQKASRGGILGAIQGQTGLYGTTPALTSTFGNQVMQAGELGQGQQALNQRRMGNIYNAASRGI